MFSSLHPSDVRLVTAIVLHEYLRLFSSPYRKGEATLSATGDNTACVMTYSGEREKYARVKSEEGCFCIRCTAKMSFYECIIRRYA